jgi:hypothetical protein
MPDALVALVLVGVAPAALKTQLRPHLQLQPAWTTSRMGQPYVAVTLVLPSPLHYGVAVGAAPEAPAKPGAVTVPQLAEPAMQCVALAPVGRRQLRLVGVRRPPGTPTHCEGDFSSGVGQRAVVVVDGRPQQEQEQQTILTMAPSYLRAGRHVEVE